ncbi:phosphate signaling complex protein PhoU [Apibacter muscae]|uniref:Phosphate signaling complex protein PhoU n=1 Tax=Apibacter muscae TaxID=2509004 RepID=A0A563DBP7_9FLAO|nr:phosphate signaling complex protein PhoU [Apibacter muscae]TWP27353.1 phosphate signaling complex protein PhoU [Apibacter muscae]TWP28573.1 phosphate signaling complex protein PhoU [Apibacter muscae]
MLPIKIKQLEILLNDFELISKTVLTQLQITQKLLTNNCIDELYMEFNENEIIIDRLEMKIREEVVFTIFTFNPLAADLRRIIAYQDSTTNLERIGDQLLNIVNLLRKVDVSNSYFQKECKQLLAMLDLVNQMVRDTLIAFKTEDTELAYQVIKEDKQVNQLFYNLNNNLELVLIEKKFNDNDLKSIFPLGYINQNLERIGDAATNIAEAVVYLTEGKDIRHKII